MRLLFAWLVLPSILFAVGSPQVVSVSTSATGTTSDSVLVEANKNRGSLVVQVKGTNPCYIAFGTTAASTTNGVYLAQYSVLQFQVGAPKEAIRAICTGGSSAIQVLEGNW